MSKAGIPQLKNLFLYYCKHGGSSKGMREVISALPAFQQSHPHLTVEARSGDGSHPYLKAEYITGYSKVISVRNYTPEQIQWYMSFLRDSHGGKSYTWTKDRLKTIRPSIQGQWNPYLDLSETK
eukprot:TRINITY_DN3932_c0_g1_i1.p1 TRINITY_DN3932_c0_g1~~TRINITY_DN3932_c0_g1_i1.p1  ORF type:complete len:138 (+),score=6.24 TRINITY_DN3932_c0_g1_i1:44-415(+)